MKQTLTQKFINSICDLVNNLMNRYYDEYEYEDIKEYINVIEKKMKVNNVRIEKRGKNFKNVWFNHPNGNKYIIQILKNEMQISRCL